MERPGEILWERSFTRTLLYILLIVWGVCAVIFAIWDLQISLILVDQNSIWARFIADYGEVPGTISIIIALFIFNRVRDKSDKRKNLLLSVLIFFFLLWQFLSLFMQISGNDSFIENLNIILVSFFGIIVIILINLLNNVNISNFQRYGTISRITLCLAILNPLLFVQSIKILWGRVRFRDLAPDYANYTPWYLPNGITGHKSFPSGHTAMGWMLLPIILLTLNKGWKTKVLLGAIVFSWGFVVGLGRVVIGAHYASDTLFSTGVALIGYIFLYRYYYFLQSPGSTKER